VKLLLITNIFPPDIGGPATFIDQLGHALAADGHRVTVVCTSAQPRVAEDRNRPFRVRRIPRRNPLEYHLRLRTTLTTELLRHRRCLINGLTDYAAPYAKRLGCRYLVKIVGDSAWERGRNTGVVFESVAEFQSRQDLPPALAAIRRRRAAWLPAASGVVVPSDYLRGLVSGWGVRLEHIHVIRNGVRLEGDLPASAQRRSEDPLRIVFVGRLTNFKGVETLLLALARVAGVEAQIIGDGPEEPLLRALAQQLRLGERAVFLGRLPSAEVHKCLSRAHALVLTSCIEGLSHTLLEAGAQGLPCIASSVGGNPEIITHEENGLLVPYGDVNALVDALQSLQRDESLRLRLATRTLEMIRRFDFQNTVNQTRELLCRI
jgi:glycosyltransferase involved in cell wall biosynthesis